jgi:YfiH family protein
MLEPIQAQCLASLPGLRHGFFTRKGGVSGLLYSSLNCGPGSSDEPSHVGENRARVAKHLGAAEPEVVTLYQTHSATALAVEGPFPANGRPKADALVTRTPGLAIGALTADCAPVLFADPEARVVGAAHAGWRGAAAGILEAAIAEMERLGGRRARIFAAIGPSINQAAYEVGPEFKAALIDGNLDNARFFDQSEPNARPHFDLPGYVESRLGAAGLAGIERQSPCTYANESLFYSFRRSKHRGEADYGRQISAIVVA